MTRRRTALDVMRGPMAAYFAGPSWRPWFCVAAAVWGLSHGLDADDLAFIKTCLGGREPPTRRTCEAFLLVGRRGGKSRFSAFAAVFAACCVDYRGVLAPGETGIVMLIAPKPSPGASTPRLHQGPLEEPVPGTACCA